MATRRTSQAETPDEGGHVVLVDMLTFRVKGRRPGTFSAARAGKGALVTLDPELNDIDYLEDLKAIAPNDGTRYSRTTAKVLAEAAGGREDPVPVPQNLFNVEDADVTVGAEDEDDDEAPDLSTPADDE